MSMKFQRILQEIPIRKIHWKFAKYSNTPYSDQEKEPLRTWASFSRADGRGSSSNEAGGRNPRLDPLETRPRFLLKSVLWKRKLFLPWCRQNRDTCARGQWESNSHAIFVKCGLKWRKRSAIWLEADLNRHGNGGLLFLAIMRALLVPASLSFHNKK